MVANAGPDQIISRLTPLADVLAALDGLDMVAPRELEAGAARGRTLALDVLVAAARPQAALALRDGWAVNAEATLDAGGYAPAPLIDTPPRLDCGDALPEGADTVAPLDAVSVRNGRAEAIAPVASGEGVLPAGGDCIPAMPLRRTGERLRGADLAVLAAAGISRVHVRVPRLRIVRARERGDAIIDAALGFISADVDALGGETIGEYRSAAELAETLRQDGADAFVVIGGTGSGRRDASVQTLARVGRVAFHGIALSPGETAGLGFAGARPVLLVPGRLDAALAVWLVVGRRMLMRLAGCGEDEPGVTATLSRKVTSIVGIAEFVPVRRNGEAVEPLAAKYLPLSALARADGWILVPPDSEGYPVGAKVTVRPWP